MDKKRVVYLDLLRLIAAMLVVMVHVSAQYIEKFPVESMGYAAANAFNCLAFSGVAVFVMISGALALHPAKETGIKNLLLHKTLRFFALYYIWKAIYQAVIIWEEGGAFTLAAVKKDIFLALLQQRGYYHLWFLPMIAILYMNVPLIQKGVAKKEVCEYFLCVFFVAALLFPTLFSYEFKFKYLFVDFFNANDFYMFGGGYTGYFILGHYLHYFNGGISKIKRAVLYAMGAASLTAACVLGVLASRKAGTVLYIMNTPFAATTFFTAAAVYMAAIKLCQKMEAAKGAGRMLQFLADRTLGIYLLHPLMLMLLAFIVPGITSYSPIIAVPIVASCVFVLSWLSAFAISKIPLLRRLIR